MSRTPLALISFCLAFLSVFPCFAIDPGPPLAENAPAADKPLVRELFVPLSELSTILEADKERVFLPREQYEQLLRDARQKMGDKPPLAAALLSADYQAMLEDERAVISGTLTFEVLAEGLHQLPLQVGRCGIRVATVDGKPARLARDPSGEVFLLSDVRGMHQLQLILTTPITTSAAQQTLTMELPHTAATKLMIQVPGNVEVKGGAPVLSRTYDEAKNVTLLEVKPHRGEMSVVMSLNNKQLRDQSLVIARGVLVDEVTLGYERLHATMAMRVVHGAADRFRFELPAGFEVTKVDSPTLSRWQVLPPAMEGGPAILEAILSEAATDTVVLEIAANRSVALADEWLASLKTWTFPQLKPLDVAGQVFVIGLLSEDRLQPYAITPTELVPIDAAVLASAIPQSVLNAEPGAPLVRQVASFYAPSSSYSLSASFEKPAAGILARGNMLLTISQQELAVHGGFALTPDAEKLFEVRFKAPANWQVSEVTFADGTPLSIERYGTVDGGTRVIVKLPTAMPKGQTATINFRARYTPPGWLSSWTTQKIALPMFELEGATRERGAVAIALLDDLIASPDEVTGLSPLLDNEKAEFGLADVRASLLYRYDTRPYTMNLTVTRTEPSITADAISFFQLEPDLVRAHYELQYTIREASTRLLSFSLPGTTPAEVSIRGMGDVVVKEYRAAMDGTDRVWTVELDARRSGLVSLAIDFVQRQADSSRKNLSLPLIAAEGVEYQSSLAAVEGSAELDVQVKTHPRKVDVGELATAEYQVGKRIVGAYGYVGSDAKLVVDMLLRDAYPLPPAIVERAQLVSKVSMQGIAQSVVRYSMITKADALEIVLPKNSTLWTVLLDGSPTKPQRAGDSLLISLPAQAQLRAREVRLVYETKLSPLGIAGEIDLAPPQLMLRAGVSREIPQADLDWKLILPAGYKMTSASSQFSTTDVPQRVHPAAKVGVFLYGLAGGVDLFYGSQISAMAPGSATFRYYDQSESMSVEEKHSAEPRPTAESSAPNTWAAPAMPMGGPMESPASERMDAPAEPMAEIPLTDAPPPPAPESPAPASDPAPALPPRSELLRDDLGGEQLAREESMEQSGGKPMPNQSAANAPPPPVLDARFWALEGVSSLAIDIEPAANEPIVTLTSLGGNQSVAATVVDQRRMSWGAVGMGLLVLLVGVALTSRSPREQWGYVSLLLLVSGLASLLGEWTNSVAEVMEAIFFAGVALVPYYALVAVARPAIASLQSWCNCVPRTTVTQITALVLVVLAMSAPNLAEAQETMPGTLVDLEKLLPLLQDGGPPVAVPADAIIVPYDPDVVDGEEKAEKVLIPYAKYVELWNLAHPEKKLDEQPLPRNYAVASASYSATLSDANELVIRGELTVDVFTKQGVSIPLALVGAMLQSATVDGKPARLSLISVADAQQKAMVLPPEIPPQITLVHLAGDGRKTISLVIHTGLVRRGGWRSVEATLPVAAATQVKLDVPLEGTEVRLTEVPDRSRWETKAAGETLVTTLGTSGKLNLQWRPQVAEAAIDQGLTARSVAVLDVREDAVRMAWNTTLEFGRGNRDRFTFLVPLDFVVEQVQGVNIRGWEVKRDGDQQTLDVTLLRTAVGSETLTIQLARRELAIDEKTKVALLVAPQVQVVGAALQQGELAVRRGNRLQLRTTQSTGLARADQSAEAVAVAQSADGLDAPVLPVSNYQSYRFVSLPYSLRLEAIPTADEVTAQVQTAVRVASRDTTIDAAIVLRSTGKPLYSIDISLPLNFRLDTLLPAGLEWSLTPAADHQRLSVQLQEGHTGAFTLTLQGLLVRDVKEPSFAVPVISVLSAARQTGEIAFLADPDTDVQITDLKGCWAIGNNLGWIQPAQRHLSRAAIGYRDATYSATAKLTTRRAKISAQSITNVKVTRRAIEETVLVMYEVSQAGIHEISLLLPDYLARARVRTPLLKRKFVEPAVDSEGKPIAGFVRLVIQLQDDVIGPLSFVLEHDRLLSSTQQNVITPQLTQAENPVRLIAIENAGLDEVLIDAKSSGLEEVARTQQLYRQTAGILGQQLNQLFRVPENFAKGELLFQTKTRDEVERPRARIELATSMLVVDAAGTYRGQQDYRLSNDTEQFLEVKLPAGSTLWTAIVAGEPVKPVELDPPVPDCVRIPLVKTAEGEGDYLIQLKYGGQMRPLSSLSEVKFPLMLTRNIKVESSQTTLYLPKNFVWQSFGGTMRHVQDQGELELGFQSYLNRRITNATQLLSSSNPFTKLRAKANLLKAKAMLGSGEAMSTSGGAEQGQYNYRLVEQAERMEAEALGLADVDGTAIDNRVRLNDLTANQRLSRSKNVVSGLGNNFEGRESKLAEQQKLVKGKFNDEWFDQNSLKSNAVDPAKKDEMESLPYQQGSRLQSRARFDERSKGLAAPQLQLSNGQQESSSGKPGESQQLAQRESGDRSGGGDYGSKEQRGLQRYQKQLDDEVTRDSQRQQFQQQREYYSSPQPGMGGPAGPQGNTFGVNPARPATGMAGGMGGPSGGGQAAMGGVETTQPPSVAMDVDAAPLAVELEAFGEQTTPRIMVEGEYDSLSSNFVTLEGLSSLDVQLPIEGDAYLFTTPRGEVSITARPVAKSMIENLVSMLIALAVIAIVVVLVRLRVLQRVFGVLRTAIGCILAAVFGFAMMICGVFPMLGMLIFVIAVVLAISKLVRSQYQPAAIGS